jgi:hypothetical protein
MSIDALQNIALLALAASNLFTLVLVTTRRSR